MATKKYRPYFTLQELELLEGSLPSTPQSYGLKRYLTKYISDIRADLRIPNHELTPSIESKLGFSEEPTPKPEDLFKRYKISNGVGMSKTDRSKALEYGYENDLLSPREEAEFESSLMSKGAL